MSAIEESVLLYESLKQIWNESYSQKYYEWLFQKDTEHQIPNYPASSFHYSNEYKFDSYKNYYEKAKPILFKRASELLDKNKPQ